MLKYLILVMSCGLMACGSSEEEETSQTSETFSYEISVNGCSTGRHTFSSLKEYCEALTNDSLNNGCAKEQRDALKSEKC